MKLVLTKQKQKCST